MQNIDDVCSIESFSIVVIFMMITNLKFENLITSSIAKLISMLPIKPFMKLGLDFTQPI
jgi:uncharacterized membrane protein YkgB